MRHKISICSKEIYIGISSKLATTLIILSIFLRTNTCYSHPEHLKGSDEYLQDVAVLLANTQEHIKSHLQTFLEWESLSDCVFS